ncbi:hypothetical protein D0962_23385 [Leptolyngbyaceae cyanobacterium CCMR0082]|uniref:Uncharacterized protein n=1 Tax=Adonisia turfae CCMR0082 TaxID=2304604 RepID=A0A6M0SC58_9CYAN|nr:hypothetical protein [Adonisia turfae]NEZ65663.1 hypothetical protein [Adonisia turfae CCMR0082]
MPISTETIRAAIHSNYLPGKILERGANFDDILEVLFELQQAKPADLYYQEILSGTTLVQLAEQEDKEVASLITALKTRGYDIPEADRLIVTVPKRIKQALESIDNFYPLFRQLLQELEDDDEPIERVYLGTVAGEKESSAEVVLDDLNDSDIERINKLPSWKRSRIDEEGLFKPKMRAILEMLVERVPELEKFRKPQDWAPWTHPTANAEKLVPTSFSAPVYVGRIAERLKIPKGLAHTKESNYSAMMRDWLDEFTEQDIPLLQPPLAFRTSSAWYSDLPSGRESVVFIAKPVISLTLTESLSQKLKAFCQKSGLAHGKFLSALMFWGLKKEQSDIPGWSEWEAFCRAKGRVDNLPETLKSLEKKGFCHLK